MSFDPSQMMFTVPMKLDVTYDVQKIVFTGPLVEIVTGTLTSLTDEMLPPNLDSIRSYLFIDNSQLTEVNLSNIMEVGNYSFSNCAIESLTMPNLMTTGQQAFSYNPITSIDLPRLSFIGSQSFQSCENLKTVNLPAATSIGRLAFYNCTNLDTLVLESDFVVMLEGTQHFYNTKIEAGTGYIYVPQSLVDSYIADSSWSAYASQIRAIS